MTKLAIAFAAVAGLLSTSACKSKSKQAGGADAIAKMQALADRLCVCADAACARKVNDEVVALTKVQSPAFTESDLKTMATLGKKAGDCLSRLTLAVSDAGSGSATPVPAGSGSETAPTGSGTSGPSSLPKECGDYKATVDRLQTCDSLPKQARETLLKAYSDAAERWQKEEGEERAKTAVSCKDAAAALLATGKARCGW